MSVYMTNAQVEVRAYSVGGNPAEEHIARVHIATNGNYPTWVRLSLVNQWPDNAQDDGDVELDASMCRELAAKLIDTADLLDTSKKPSPS